MISNPNQRNAEQTPLYDTYELAANTATPTTIVFFANPLSATKAKNKTILGRPYQIGAGDLFHMIAMRFVALGMDDADLVNFMKNYCAQFILNRTPLLEAPIEFFPGGAGVSGFATTTKTDTTIKHVNNGVADPRAIAAAPSSLEILIDGSNTFEVDLVGTTFTSLATGPGLFLRCYLDGVWEKA